MPQYIDVSHLMRPTHKRKRLMGRAGILLHSTEGRNSRDWLQGNVANQEKIASADFLIDRLGNIEQLVPVGYYTFHCGPGRWHNFTNDRDFLNEALVGIEMESHASNTPRYTDAQLISCAHLVRRLMFQHMLGIVQIDYHGFVATPTGRRSDPVNFPGYVWSVELLNPSPPPAELVFPTRLP